MKRDAPRILWLGLPAALLLGAYLGGALQETREARVSQRLQDKLTQLEENRASFPTTRAQLPPTRVKSNKEAIEREANEIVDRALERHAWTHEDSRAWAKVSPSLEPKTESKVLRRAVAAINRQELRVTAATFPL